MKNTAPTFSEGSGKVFTDFGSSFDESSSLFIQSDGKTLIAGSRVQKFNSYTGSKYDFAISRYNSDGSIDNSFGTNGIVVTDFASSFDQAFSVVQMLDGKIYVGGTSDEGLAIVRYTVNGSLDSSYGLNGKVTNSTVSGKILAGDANGNILIAGSKQNNNTLTRYLNDGRLDTSFGINGSTVSNFAGSDPYLRKNVTGLLIQTDGKIVVESYGDSSWDGASTSFTLARFNTNGTLDSSFGQEGMVTTIIDTYNSPSGLTIQSDGKLLVTGSIKDNGNFKVLLLRYESNGKLDTSFGLNGKVTTSFTNNWDQGTCVAVQKDGKILVVASNGLDLLLARYNSNGSLDISFDGDGKVICDLGNYDKPSGIGFQADGKILISGSTRNYDGSVGDFALVRFNTDGSLDKSFSPSTPFQNTVSYVENSTIILNENLQVNDAELSSLNNFNGATLSLSRLGGANSQDVFSSTGVSLSSLIQNSYFAVDDVTIGRVITNSNGNLTLAFNANATLTLVNKAINQISYVNISDAPPVSIKINWLFSDGNTSQQGDGGVMSVTGVSNILITATNDAPLQVLPVSNQRVTTESNFNFQIPTGTFVDPDLETLYYTAKMADGTGMPPWLNFNASTQTFSGTPSKNDMGTLNILLTAKDSAGASRQAVFPITISNQNTISGTLGSDSLVGTENNDFITASEGNDTIIGGLGDDTIDGGIGLDTVKFTYTKSDYSIQKISPNSWTVTYYGPVISIYPRPLTEGMDTLINVERLQFSDKSIALDLDGNAGITAKLLVAIFGKQSITNKNYVGIGLSLLDSGWTYDNVAGLALNAAGAITNDQVVTLLWANLLGFLPSSADKKPYISLLENGMSQGALAQLAAEHSFTSDYIKVTGITQIGIEYLQVS
jgi:uncharacterized delta-60 repeat protein